MDPVTSKDAIRSTTVIDLNHRVVILSVVCTVILSAVCMPPAVQSEEQLNMCVNTWSNEDTYILKDST